MDRVLAFLPGLLIFGILYFRVRRLFSRQRFSLPRQIRRTAVLLSLSGLLMVFAPLEVRTKLFAAAVGLGLAAASALSTRWERHEGLLFYVPNRYVGLLVLSVLVGRVLYRLGTLASGGQVRLSGLSAALAVMFLTYYAIYNLALLGHPWLGWGLTRGS